MKEAPNVERLWQAARFMPQTVRLLGTRYRSLFLAYGQLCHLITTLDIDGDDGDWAAILTAGIRHPNRPATRGAPTAPA